jgi:hypothetical protein
VSIQSKLAALAVNLKRIAAILSSNITGFFSEFIILYPKIVILAIYQKNEVKKR